MNLEVEHIDTTGAVHNLTFNISRLAFIKHMAMAGQGYPSPRKLMRTLGMFFHYSYYLQRQSFDNDHFSLPPQILSDPTEQGQFSNIAGKAIADFLAKAIDNGFYTTNYEALATRPMRGGRPDLIAFSPNSQFTLEAKGRKERNSGNMQQHKIQAQSGNYPRNFSIACVSYDLYRSVKCKYHDPFNDNVRYDSEGLKKSSQRYYGGLSEFLNRGYFRISETNYTGEGFFEVELDSRYFRNFLNDHRFHPFWYEEFFNFYQPRLILPQNIVALAENGLTQETKPFVQLQEGSNLYIDSDRVGLRI